MLLEKFAFAPSDKEIYWNMAPIVAPIIKGTSDSTATQLPLKVTLLPQTH